jgi:DNA-binding Lrp family transcriptional regulator
MDAIDRKVVAQLQADGRTTLKELAQITGFTSMGTKKRLERLIQ